jgi:hypothetical protein
MKQVEISTPKHLLTFNGLHDVTSQKREIFFQRPLFTKPFTIRNCNYVTEALTSEFRKLFIDALQMIRKCEV